MKSHRAIIAYVLAVVLVSLAQSGARAQADKTTLPPNYRQLIVQTIWARTDARMIRSARISAPQELWMGLLAGGNRQAICVEVFRDTPITTNARDLWVFTFKDGGVDTARYMYADCKGYSPFYELLKRK